jgi:hypothetical protein
MNIKRGNVREDGKIYWGKNKDLPNGEYWVTSEKFIQLKEIYRDWYKKNIEKTKDRNRVWREKNLEKAKERCREWRKNNREKYNKKKRDYMKSRRESDPIFKFRGNISHLIRNSLTRKGFTKRSKAYQILGCSYMEFFDHIESKFQDGMTWDNRNLWHIDHIIPVSSAKTEQELLNLNHYTNLQPLWALDNIKKSNKTPTTTNNK